MSEEDLGAFLQRYTSAKAIQSGMSGYVVKMRDTETNTDVAVKFFYGLPTFDGERLAAEVRFMQSINSDYVVRPKQLLVLHKACEIKRPRDAPANRTAIQAIMVMDLEGPDLFAFTFDQAEGKWGSESKPDDLFWQIAVTAAKGIAALHTRGYAHRDIKPENIAVSKRNNKTSAVILDLDFNCKVCATHGDGCVHEENETICSLSMKMTAGYAPEAAWEQVVRDARPDDIYSLGGSLYVFAEQKEFKSCENVDSIECSRQVPNYDFEESTPQMEQFIRWLTEQPESQRPTAVQIVAYLEKRKSKKRKAT